MPWSVEQNETSYSDPTADGAEIESSLIEESDSQRQTVERWLPGAAERGSGELLLKVCRASVLTDEKSSVDGWW